MKAMGDIHYSSLAVINMLSRPYGGYCCIVMARLLHHHQN